MVRAKEKHTST